MVVSSMQEQIGYIPYKIYNMIYELKQFIKTYNELNELMVGYIMIEITEGVQAYTHGYNLDNDELALVTADIQNLTPIVEYQCAVGRKAFEAFLETVVEQIPLPNAVAVDTSIISIDPDNVQENYDEL